MFSLDHPSSFLFLVHDEHLASIVDDPKFQSLALHASTLGHGEMEWHGEIVASIPSNSSGSEPVISGHSEENVGMYARIFAYARLHMMCAR